MSTKKKDQQADSSKETAQHADNGSTRDSAAKSSKDASKGSTAVKSDKAAKQQPKPQPKAKKKDDGEIGENIKDVRQFLREVHIEYNKITWPDRAQVVRETYSVLMLVALITVMVLAFDWFLGGAIFGPLEHFARMHGGGIGHG